jgi:hydrogenase maturation factor
MSTEPSRPGPAALLPPGKLPLALLTRLLGRCEVRDPRVVVGPRVGEDAAVLELGDRYLVATSDPITFVAEEIGWYAVQVNANDLAVRGARPAWFLMTLLLPEGSTDAALAETIFGQVEAACRSIGATLVGGHTEITHGLGRPILAGTMLGEVERGRLVTTAGARPGDRLLLSKGIALEGASILAREGGGRLGGLSAACLDRARGFLRQPGISVVPEARLALEAATVHAMHDPTEGGLATGLLELALASGVGLEVEEEAIPVLPECAALCAALGLDPLGLIASGSLLLACPPAEAAGLLDAWRMAGIAGQAIGTVLPAGEGLWLTGPAGRRPLPRFARDEAARRLDT